MRTSATCRCRETVFVMEASASSEASTSSPSSLFGSPIEPIYTENKHVLTTDLLQDSLTLLSWKNDSAVQEAATNTQYCMALKSGCPVLFIFELCKYFKLSSEVQYKAVELFHRFMVNHITELYEHVMMASRTTRRTTRSPIQWCDVENRLRHQVILRAVSCVQLASKLGSHYHLVTLNRARSFLISCGFQYVPASIVQSEIRVLKTLQYQVHQPTPLEYIEVLLGSLVHNKKTMPVKHLHALSLKILDVFYLRRQSIREKLENLSVPDPERNIGPEVVMATVENDQMLLASAVITAAGFILGQSKTKHISCQLSKITCIVNEDIINFGSILLEEIFTEECEVK